MRNITDYIPRYLSDIKSITSVLKNYYIEFNQSKYIEVFGFTFLNIFGPKRFKCKIVNINLAV